MINTYLARELAMQFTATKRVPNKLLFKDYHLCSCILGKKSIIEEYYAIIFM